MNPEHGERPREDVPRIYVADIAAYNNGYMFGEWIDATQEPEAMWEQITGMLGRSPIPGAEEHAIHDFDNFGPVQLSEFESIDTVAKIGQGAMEHGRAFLHWVAYIGTSDPDGIDRFEDHYLGQYDSYRELGEELAGAEEIDRLIEEHLPEFIQPYVQVDYEAFGSDMASGCHTAEDDGAIYVFDP